jgi:hypothetical protein
LFLQTTELLVLKLSILFKITRMHFSMFPIDYDDVKEESSVITWAGTPWHPGTPEMRNTHTVVQL